MALTETASTQVNSRGVCPHRVAGNCPSLKPDWAIHIFMERIKSTPRDRKEAVELYDHEHILNCLDRCSAFGEPPNPTHFVNWQALWFQHYGIYQGYTDETTTMQHYDKDPVVVRGHEEGITQRERFHVYYSARYLSPKIIDLIRESENKNLLNWAEARRKDAEAIARRVLRRDNATIEEAAEYLELVA